MKKIIALLLILALVTLCACKGKEEVSRELLEHDFTPAYEGIETEYVYQFDYLVGEFRLMPDIHTVRHKAKYQLMYRITYDDNSHEDIWEEVSQKEYDNAVKELTGEE